jgi:DNA invertase Pin-like site-specific DNA recombinase
MAKANSTGNGSHVPAVSYIRMSSDKQEESPDQQRQEIAKLAASGGYHVLREYFDSAISGDATKKRKSFQRMIADAERGEFRVILSWDQDRFGRFDSIEAGRWIYPLREHGVKLVTVAQGEVDWTSFAGRIIYNVQQEGKHAFLRDMSRNSLRGRMKSASVGVWMTKAPFGYTVRNTKDAKNRVISSELLVGDRREVAIVQRMFRDYHAGHSVRGIAFALNSEGLYTRSGKPWAAKTALCILTNPTYAGRYRWNVKTQGKYHAVRNGNIVADFSNGIVDASDWFTIDDHHEAIIEPAKFDAVQRMLRERKCRTTPKRNGGAYLFTSLLRCGKCGDRMYGLGGAKYPSYRCGANANHNLCDRNSVNQNELLDVVLRAITERFTDAAVVQRLRNTLLAKATRPDEVVSVSELRKQLDKLDADLSKSRRNMALADGDDLRREYESVVRGLRQERDRLDGAIRQAQKPSGRTRDEQAQRIEKAIDALQRLRVTFTKAKAVTQRELLRTAIERIDVWSKQGDRHHQRWFCLQRGVIRLRSEMWLPAADNLIPLNCRRYQVIADLLTIPFAVSTAT